MQYQGITLNLVGAVKLSFLQMLFQYVQNVLCRLKFMVAMFQRSVRNFVWNLSVVRYLRKVSKILLPEIKRPQIFASNLLV